MSKRLILLFLSLFLVVAAAAPSGSQAPSGARPARSWLGKWIWTEGEPSPRNSYTYFRKTFQFDGPQKEAKVNITADSRYQLFVNGAFVGRGPVRSDRRWLYYDSWDVGSRLKKGKNVVAVLVHHYGEFTFQYMQGRGGLLAELTGADGRAVLQTDETWRALRSEAWRTGQPRMSIQLGFSEVYDARKAPPAWKEASFDDRGWPAAREIGPVGMEPWPNLVARDIPPMLEEPQAPKRVLDVAEVELPEGAQYVDLLKLMEPKEWAVAYLATNIVSPDRREVELRFGSDDALKVWLNGKPVVSHLIGRGAAPDQEQVRVTLQPGKNPLLAKVVQGHSKWEFYFRMAGKTDGVDLQGPPVMQAGADWAVAGAFPYPRDETLKTGFDTAFPPEAGLGKPLDWSAQYPVRGGKEIGWAHVVPERNSFPLVSQLMAAETRRPLRGGSVEGQELLFQDGATGARIRTAPDADVSLLVDFGKEVTGFPRFRVRGAKGGEVLDMGYGEVLQDEGGGFIPQSSDRLGKLNPDRDGVHYADRYVCRPGLQEFQTFDKRGFRYLQIDVRNAPEGIELDGVGLLFSTFPVKYKGAFQCSDERLNRIWEIGRYTCQLNMEDGYTDCPWRERGQWWGDARVESLINYYCFGDATLIRKALRQHGQSLNEEGITWGVYPTDWDGGRLPSFTLIWVSTLWDYYQHTGDRSLVRELYPKIRASLDKFFAPKVGERGLLRNVPYWVFIDWAPVDTDGESGALNAYYYDALRAAGAMGRLLNDASAPEYEKRADAVKAAMNARLWDPAAHAYRDSLRPDGALSAKISQQTNSLCVLFDIAPREEQARVLDFIYAPANRERVVEAGSPYFSFYQLAALYHAERNDQAMSYIREHWGKMLDWGATTWWEMWAPGASFCHGWSGGPTYNFGAEVLGVKPLKPGFAEVRVEPHWAGLQWATGVVPTAKGDVRVAWQRDEKGKSAAVRVETPQGVPVEIELPNTGEVKVNKKVHVPVGVTQVPSRPGTTRFRVEQGGTTLLELHQP
jgi:hypothetical protein